jgi:hypothetical protein
MGWHSNCLRTKTKANSTLLAIMPMIEISG